VIRQLWTGDTVNHRGDFYEVQNARLFDPPDPAPPIVVSAFGPKALELAGRIGDGYWGHTPDADMIAAYEAAGGSGPRYAQLDVCWNTSVDTARQIVHEVWPNGGVPGQLSQDLPTFTHFEEAAQIVSVDDATESVSCGPDVEPILESVAEFVDAGYDHLYFHQIGPDQDGFLEFWSDTLRPALADAHGG
jgi:G6PDH family F420-dependent oxidoreductase